jgi:hypothetical protein
MGAGRVIRSIRDRIQSVACERPMLVMFLAPPVLFLAMLFAWRQTEAWFSTRLVANFIAKHEAIVAARREDPKVHVFTLAPRPDNAGVLIITVDVDDVATLQVLEEDLALQDSGFMIEWKRHLRSGEELSPLHLAFQGFGIYSLALGIIHLLIGLITFLFPILGPFALCVFAKPKNRGSFAKETVQTAMLPFILAFMIVSPHATTYAAEDATPSTLPLTKNAAMTFATAEQGQAVLSKRDRFVDAQSPWDRQARLKTNREVSVDEYLKFAAGEVIEWSDADRRKLTASLEKVRERLRPWDFPWPRDILLIQTTGKEEGRAAYCRQNAIVLPKNIVGGRGTEAFERLLLHELFHILSSHNDKLRERLYAIVGFTNCGQIELPADLAARKITNPDAPSIEHAIELSIDDKPVLAVPILLAEPAKYDAAAGKEFFAHMQFRLLVVGKTAEGKTAVKLTKGKPQLLDPAATPSYHEKIGRNTGYIIHPEEILADNFVLLVTGEADVKTPTILDEMKKILNEPSSK